MVSGMLKAGAVQESFLVGVKDGVLFFVNGRGRSWEEALAKANQNYKKPA
jgi:hypothetical protein